MININDIIKYTQANLIVITNKEGQVLESYQTDYYDNIGLMSKASFEMCHDLLSDITSSDLHQLVAKNTNNYFIINKTNDGKIVLIASNQISKLGLLMKYMNNL